MAGSLAAHEDSSDYQYDHQNFPPYIRLKNEDGTEDIHYSLFYRGVPNELIEIAEKELNETEENKINGIQKLRDYLNREELGDVDDNTLILVLRNCKYDVKKSQDKLKRYLSIRQTLIDKLQEADFVRLENVLDNNAVGMLPYRDKHGRAVFFTTPNVNFDQFDLEEAALCYFACVFFFLTFPMTSIAGIAYIAECKSSSSSIFYRIVNTFKNYMWDVLNLPIKLARIEFINENVLVRLTYNILRPILSSKLLERVSFYSSNLQDLQELYHPDMLPQEFGGNMGPMNPKKYKEEVLNFMRKLKSEKTR